MDEDTGAEPKASYFEARARLNRWGAWVLVALGVLLVALTIWVLGLAIRAWRPSEQSAPEKPAAVASTSAALLAAREGLTANLWTRASLEYPLTVRTIYVAATAALPTATTVVATEDKEHFGKPATRRRAVVLDLDETALNNSPQQAGTIARGESFSPTVWDEWVSREAEEALPGAVEFTRAAEKAGVAVFYVTNRECPKPISDNAPFASLEKDCPQKFHTMRRMQALGFARADDMRAFYFHKQEAALMGEGTDKQLRRARIARDFDIVMLVGDDLGDFMPKAMVADDRAGRLSPDMVGAVEKLFGRSWFLLPNPTYGSWDSFLRGKYCPGDIGKDLIRCAGLLYPALNPASPPPKT
jgi:acid phosphatase